VRGIPILVILLIFYFAIGPWLRDNLGIPMPETTRAMLGLAFAYGAFLAEIFRAGIQSINRGQMEAARSLGTTYFQAMRNVILPQAIRVVLPPLGNDFIAMLKDTSLVAAISQHELTYLAIQFESERLKAFEPFLTIAALYLVMTLVLSFLVRIIENRTRLPGLM
jgi:polar amino acid transport system permease protein